MDRRRLQRVQSRGSAMHVELASNLSVVFTVILSIYLTASYLLLIATSSDSDVTILCYYPRESDGICFHRR